MRVAFTGTLFGMTWYQRSQLLKLLNGLAPGWSFNHGGARGADTDAHEVAYAAGCRDIHVWLPIGRNWPPMQYTTVHRTNLPPLQRNQLIIRGQNLLVASPRQAREIRRSGTWATVRLARKQAIETIVLAPEPAV